VIRSRQRSIALATVTLAASAVMWLVSHKKPPKESQAAAPLSPPVSLPRSDPPFRLGLAVPSGGEGRDAGVKLEVFKQSELTPPPLPREFRGTWIASVGNIDWPSKPELSVAAQQAELIALLDRAASLKLNAIILQVRPASDALYRSDLEPWSHYLTGEMGKAPEPFYDPLEFAVTEAHKRGLELHAWFNPFRALTTKRNVSLASANHITRTNPELVRAYGDLLWLDPGEPAVRSHVLDVITDVVRRYDIDAVHLDDYFYPYVTKDKRGKSVPFPDDPSWQQYLAGGGALTRDDWRRENINDFVRDLYRRIKAEKQWVKLGISPFGIWRPQKELSIAGLDAFAELYADSRKWLEKGWLDYISPQLYWSTDAPKQSYPVLLQWWAEANSMHRHLWPGIATDRIGAARSASDILGQIAHTRSKSEAAGNIHWHIKALVENLGQVSDRLGSELYANTALVPASSWLGAATTERPELSFASARLQWSIKDASAAQRWAVQTRRGGKWSFEIVPGTETTRLYEPADLPEALAITALDRYGNGSPVAVLELAPIGAPEAAR
jgi:uncharacterized lipoprotein YddW (UPF0748 family)